MNSPSGARHSTPLAETIYLAENARIIGYKSSMPDEKRIPEVGAAHLNVPSKRCSIRRCVFIRERALVAVLMDIKIVCVPASYKALIHHIFLSCRDSSYLPGLLWRSELKEVTRCQTNFGQLRFSPTASPLGEQSLFHSLFNH